MNIFIGLRLAIRWSRECSANPVTSGKITSESDEIKTMALIRGKTVSQKADASVRDEWMHSLQDLADQVSEWAKSEPDWRVDPISLSSIAEDEIGAYEAPVVTIHAPNGRLIVEPIARNFPGRGIVEFYAWPTLFRVRLLRGDGDADWQIRVDSGFVLDKEWNRDSFIQLGNNLLGAS